MIFVCVQAEQQVVDFYRIQKSAASVKWGSSLIVNMRERPRRIWINAQKIILLSRNPSRVN